MQYFFNGGFKKCKSFGQKSTYSKKMVLLLNRMNDGRLYCVISKIICQTATSTCTSKENSISCEYVKKVPKPAKKSIFFCQKSSEYFWFFFQLKITAFHKTFEKNVWIFEKPYFIKSCQIFNKLSKNFMTELTVIHKTIHNNF